MDVYTSIFIHLCLCKYESMYIHSYVLHTICAGNTLPPLPPPPRFPGFFGDVSRMHTTRQMAAKNNFFIRTSFYTLMVFLGVFAVCYFSARGEISRFFDAGVRLMVVEDAAGLSHTHTYVYTHTHTHTYVHTCVHSHTHLCTHVCTHTQTHLCTRVCTHTQVCTHTRMCIHTSMCTYIRMCTHTHVCVHA